MSKAQARKNLAELIAEAGRTAIKIESDPEGDECMSWSDHVQSYAFDVTLEGCDRPLPILMPGTPAKQWKDSLWRLYVDGNSWMWKYAVSTVREHGDGEEDE